MHLRKTLEPRAYVPNFQPYNLNFVSESKFFRTRCKSLDFLYEIIPCMA